MPWETFLYIHFLIFHQTSINHHVFFLSRTVKMLRVQNKFLKHTITQRYSYVRNDRYSSLKTVQGSSFYFFCQSKAIFRSKLLCDEDRLKCLRELKAWSIHKLDMVCYIIYSGSYNIWLAGAVTFFNNLIAITYKLSTRMDIWRGFQITMMIIHLILVYKAYEKTSYLLFK